MNPISQKESKHYFNLQRMLYLDIKLSDLELAFKNLDKSSASREANDLLVHALLARKSSFLPFILKKCNPINETKALIALIHAIELKQNDNFYMIKDYLFLNQRNTYSKVFNLKGMQTFMQKSIWRKNPEILEDICLNIKASYVKPMLEFIDSLKNNNQILPEPTYIELAKSILLKRLIDNNIQTPKKSSKQKII